VGDGEGLDDERPDSDFDGEKYMAASHHQKEWGVKLIEELHLRGDERVIDLGCGDGVLTHLIAQRVDHGSVLGVDSSPSMIATAKKLERNNLKFVLMDIQDLNFRDEFDVFFSNSALHWVRDHDRLLDNVLNGLRDGGRVRFNFAGDGNCSNFFTVVREVMALPRFHPYFEAAPWPWFMPAPAEYEALVLRKGFTTYHTWTENADRYFTKDELVRWIDQPSLVPLVALVKGEEKSAMRDLVVEKMIERTKTSDGRYFETFRRQHMYAIK
jgi:trans-aconitate 2-methyltransferase